MEPSTLALPTTAGNHRNPGPIRRGAPPPSAVTLEPMYGESAIRDDRPPSRRQGGITRLSSTLTELFRITPTLPIAGHEQCSNNRANDGFPETSEK